MKLICRGVIVATSLIIVFTGQALLKPLRNSTTAVDQMIYLKSGKTIAFEPSYDYGYTIQLMKPKSDESIYETISYVLSIDGKQSKKSDKFPVANAFNEIGAFKAESGADCQLKFTHVGPQLNGQKVLLKIDVNGGGPSVSNTWEIELRPLINVVFWISTTLFLGCLFLSFKRKIAQN